MNSESYIQKKIREKNVLIAAHQGTFGGNIGSNTISSGKNALLHGADIIEADVTRDTEGVLYMFHDAHEPFNFAVDKHIPEMTTAEVSALRSFNANGDKCLPAPVRLDDYLKYFKDKDCIINLDICAASRRRRGWRTDGRVKGSRGRHRSGSRGGARSP